jgi:hypothetical protein
MSLETRKVYHYHPISLELCGWSLADASPLEPDVFLLPAHATFIEPPSIPENKVCIFMDKRWQIRDPVPKNDDSPEPPPKDQWDALEKRRKELLTETDYLFMADYPKMTPDVEEAWKKYRQALRDLPSVTIDPSNPTWPIKPF